jgi:hypothetical protein
VHAEPPPCFAKRLLPNPAQRPELDVREPHALHAAQVGGARFARRQRGEPALRLEQLFHLKEEPGIDPRGLRDLIHRDTREERPLDLEDALGRGRPQRDAQILRVVAGQPVVRERRARDPARPADLQGAQPLLERFLERASDGH